MNIRDLKYLVALSEYKHFGKAAEACFVSQPALSMQIKKLEKYLEVQLLERTNRSVLLTSVGEQIAAIAAKVLDDVGNIREIAKLTKDPFQSELKLGLIPTLAPYLLPHIMPVLSKAMPKLELYLLEEQTHVLIDKLHSGKVDAAILSPSLEKTPQQVRGDNFKVINLFSEEFLLAVHEKEPLAKRKTINQAGLAGNKLLLLDDGHCLRDQALSVCQANRAKEMHGFRATSLETLRYMVASGIGMTLMPKLAVRKDAHVRYIPFSKPKPTRQISLVFRPTTVKAEVLTELAKLIKALNFPLILQ